MTPTEPHRPAVLHPTPAAWAVGSTFDSLELQALLHEGKTSQIWQVKNTRNDEILALKAAYLEAESLLRLGTERTLLQQLKGPHVPELKGHGEHDGRPYMLIELLTGPSLSVQFKTQTLTIQRGVEVACQLACALHHIHRQGALHLDLQPGHVMFRATGEAVLLSWGLARHDQQPDLQENTLDLDSSAYLSPEQIQWQRDDLRSDLFSWAVVVYQGLTGQLPFGQPRTPAQLRQRLYKPAMPPQSLRPECPPWLQDILLRNMEAASERHPNAAQLLMALRHPVALDKLGERAHRTTPGPSLMPWWQAWLPGLHKQLSRPPAHRPRSIPLWAQLLPCPLIMVLVDVDNDPTSQVALRQQTEQLLCSVPQAHLLCVALQRARDDSTPQAPSAPLSYGADTSPPKALSLKAKLDYWAHPLVHHSPAQCLGGISFHVLPLDSSSALGLWVQSHLIDHLVVGADWASAMDDADLAGQLGCIVTIVPAEPYLGAPKAQTYSLP